MVGIVVHIALSANREYRSKKRNQEKFHINNDMKSWQKRDFEILKRTEEEERKRREQKEKRKKEYEEQNGIIRSRSEKLKQIELLNRYAPPFNINTVHLTRQFNSKKAFDEADLEEELTKEIKSKLDDYLILIKRSEEAYKRYQEYSKQFFDIMNGVSPSETAVYAEYPYFRQREQELCSQMKKQPPTSILVTIQKKYVSPKGQKQYQNVRHFSYHEVEQCFLSAVHSSADQRNDAQQERGRLTPSLRYDIMKRDGFRCVLCGASAKDGAKLHVDHIFPVSKGGKTEPDNLRTLCESCNRGKGAKYDFNGEN